MNNNSLLCVFLNLNIGDTLTGIEVSAVQRSKLFIEYLNINPILLTVRYNPFLQGKVSPLIDSKKAHKDIKIFSLFDMIQGFDKPKEYKKTELVCPKELTFKQVKNTIDLKYFDKFDNLVMYEVYDKKTDRLSHINYFNNGKIYKRDKFHFNGLLSSSQFLDSQNKQIKSEIFFNYDGKPVITKYFNYINNQNQLFQIHILNSNGNVEEIFFNENDFINYSLSIFIQKTQKNNIFILSDKSKYVLMPSIHVKEKFADKNIQVMPIIHSTHTKSSTEIENGQIKSHYKDIFNNLSKIDKIAVLTNYQKEDILSRFAYNNMDVIPHTYIHIDKNAKYNPVKGKVLYVARYAPEKNHQSAFNIFSMVVKKIPWATLHCYGHGNEKEKLKSMVNDLKLENNIFLHDYTNDTEELYCSSELSILTSEMEGFSLSLLESIAMGCPVIANDIRYGPSDLITNGFNGFLIQLGDEKMFADKIINILTDSKIHKKMSKNSKLVFEQNFSPKTIVKSWKNIINSY